MCFCDRDESFELCCEKYLKNLENPKEPVELMRSRYSAFVTKNIEYLVKTDRKSYSEVEKEDLKNYCNQVEFKALEIVDYGDSFVEFKAYYILNEKLEIQHEKSYFVKQNDSWLYDRGDILESKISIARNDKCLCGSGKKFKKCCGIYL